MNNPLSPVTPELIQHVLHSENNFSRAEQILQLPGNPYGVVIEAFGDAKAVLFTKGAFRQKSRVSGEVKDIGRFLPEILALYRSHGLQCQIPLRAHEANQKITDLFLENGLRPRGAGATLIGVPHCYYVPDDLSVEVEEWGRDKIEDYVSLYLRGDEVAEKHREDIRNFELCEYRETGIRFFAALLEGNPVAVGSMVIDGKVARLKSAATLPEFRRRGCQTALLKARFDCARESECDYVVVSTGLHSNSHRNLERLGMKLLSVGTTWMDV